MMKQQDLNKYLMPGKNYFQYNFILQQNVFKQKLKGPARKFELSKGITTLKDSRYTG